MVAGRSRFLWTPKAERGQRQQKYYIISIVSYLVLQNKQNHGPLQLLVTAFSLWRLPSICRSPCWCGQDTDSPESLGFDGSVAHFRNRLHILGRQLSLSGFHSWYIGRCILLSRQLLHDSWSLPNFVPWSLVDHQAVDCRQSKTKDLCNVRNHSCFYNVVHIFRLIFLIYFFSCFFRQAR